MSVARLYLITYCSRTYKKHCHVVSRGFHRYVNSRSLTCKFTLRNYAIRRERRYAIRVRVFHSAGNYRSFRSMRVHPRSLLPFSGWRASQMHFRCNSGRPFFFFETKLLTATTTEIACLFLYDDNREVFDWIAIISIKL